MEIRAAEISAILKQQIANFGSEADVSEVGQVLSIGTVTFNHAYDQTNRRISQTATDNSWWPYPTGPSALELYGQRVEPVQRGGLGDPGLRRERQSDL